MPRSDRAKPMACGGCPVFGDDLADLRGENVFWSRGARLDPSHPLRLMLPGVTLVAQWQRSEVGFPGGVGVLSASPGAGRYHDPARCKNANAL